MLLKLNLQKFANFIPGVTGLTLIKIKLKDTITYGSLEEPLGISISFTSNGTSFTFFEIDPLSSRLMYDSTITYKTSGGYTNANYQYIEIDPTQPNFQAFITAMKSNIKGVELEAGTYKWVDSPLSERTEDLDCYFNFKSFNINYTEITLSYENKIIFYYVNDNDYSTVYNNFWPNDAYKTITTTSNQYIDYDFYNYAILGNQLVKQGGGGVTNKLKFGTETPTKLYMGETEVTKAYMGETLVYEKSSSSGETWLLNESLGMDTLSKQMLHLNLTMKILLGLLIALQVWDLKHFGIIKTILNMLLLVSMALIQIKLIAQLRLQHHQQVIC